MMKEHFTICYVINFSFYF